VEVEVHARGEGSQSPRGAPERVVELRQKPLVRRDKRYVCAQPAVGRGFRRDRHHRGPVLVLEPLADKGGLDRRVMQERDAEVRLEGRERSAQLLGDSLGMADEGLHFRFAEVAAAGVCDTM